MEDKATVVVPNALRQVDVRIMFISLDILQLRSQNRRILVSFNVKADIVRAVFETTTSPCEST